MLVLTRRIDETVTVGPDVRITIVDVRGDKVRLGIQAPAEVEVHRLEVFNAIQRKREQQ